MSARERAGRGEQPAGGTAPAQERRRAGEPSGQAESLWGRIAVADMGSRTTRTRPADSGRSLGAIGALPGAAKKGGVRSILDAASDLATLSYRPRTRETTQAWEYLLTFVSQCLGGDQPRDIIASAADETLAVLKDEGLRDLERKAAIEQIAGPLTSDRFAQLVNLGKRITDYSPVSAAAVAAAGDRVLDEDAGIAVVFEEEDDEEEDQPLIPDDDELEQEEEWPQVTSADAFIPPEEDARDAWTGAAEREETGGDGAMDTDEQGPKTIDLDELAFPQGGHTMTNKKCIVPEKTVKISRPGYEEIHIPAPAAKPLQAGERLVAVSSLPVWAQPAFSGVDALNRIQSRLHPKALETDENFLLCAPTGAGKTNVALLAILREIGKHVLAQGDDGSVAVDRDAFKIVYIAPMKALVQEMVANFGKKLAAYGVRVAELTGDQQLTKAQIADTQVLVTTPEKWDVITRKNNDASYTRLVRLVIFDEIHLLHDDRGPVIEALVARSLRQAEQTQQWVRLVGLSATLPNYVDVGRFLRVSPQTGIFFFDASFRPCPLAQQYVGVTEKKPLKRMQLMNEIVYEKVVERAGQSQVLIFVHSRKDTAKTARAIRDTSISKETVALFLKESASSRDVLASAAESAKNADLKDLLPYGFAIHHAGMTRPDRSAVEALFAAGHIQVLLSTATLAWGVNLPAHTVIIKGTQIYNPGKGRWCELSAQDVLQMLGRAGRPQYDTEGEGIIITTHSELQFYLSLLNQQLPIESQMISKLVDHMNAEIVLGSIRNRREAVEWLGYTYLYVRMLREPLMYGVTPEELADDPHLRKRRQDIVHSAAIVLEKANLLRYDRKTGIFNASEQSRVASYYYIGHQSMATYNQHLRSNIHEMDLFRIFALSHEFKLIPVRQEEKLELQKLSEKVPIPVRENSDEPVAKVNILLQAYISQLSLEGFALASDMIYVTQSAGRIMRALFEMCLRRGWARVAHRALDICKMVEKRMWQSMSPLRQLGQVPIDLLRKLERKDFPWERLFHLNSQELGELIRTPKAGKTLHDALAVFPRLSLQAQSVPLTRELLRMEITITPEFTWSEALGGGKGESFWLLVEDVDRETILYADTFLLKAHLVEQGQAQNITIHVPLLDPLPPVYFVTLTSDSWIGCAAQIPVVMTRLILPEKKSAPTEPVDMPLLTPAVFQQAEIRDAYLSQGLDTFSQVPSLTFPVLFRSDENVFIGACSGSGKTRCAEFCIWRMLVQDPSAKCVFIAPKIEMLPPLKTRWDRLFAGHLGGGKEIVLLTGDSGTDLKVLERGGIILGDPKSWDHLSRRWKSRKSVQNVDLFIVDSLHMLSSDPTIEVIASRMRYMAAQLERTLRIVALSAPIWNVKELTSWLGVSQQATFNFDTSFGSSVSTQIQGFNYGHYPSMLLAMTRPAFVTASEAASALVFATDSRQARATALDFAALSAATGRDRSEPAASVCDEELADCLCDGIGFLDLSMSDSDKDAATALYASGTVRILVVSMELLWVLPDALRPALVIVMGTQYFCGREHRYVDYPIAEVLVAVGRAGSSALVMCHSVKRALLITLLGEPLPVESALDTHLTDHFNSEISVRTIESKQDAVDYLTWSYLYRRLARNPNYYGVATLGPLAISEYMSELVETTISELVDAKCVSVEEDGMSLSSLNLGLIASYYGVHCVTVEMFALSLSSSTKIRGILECVSAAAEFDLLPIRHREKDLLERLHSKVPIRPGSVRFSDPHLKTSLLLQAHFSRMELPADSDRDRKDILGKVLPLVQACVDVLSSFGYLAPAVAAMEFSQMCVQAIWDSDPPIKQLPFFDVERLQDAQSKELTSVYDLDASLLQGLSPEQQAQVAAAANRYPAMEVQYGLDSACVAVGEDFTLRAVISRQVAVDGPVFAPHYPQRKEESWWLLVGDPSSRTLLGIKRFVMVADQINVALSFAAPAVTGQHSVKLYLVCDCYMGADQEFDLSLLVERAEIPEQ